MALPLNYYSLVLTSRRTWFKTDHPLLKCPDKLLVVKVVVTQSRSGRAMFISSNCVKTIISVGISELTNIPVSEYLVTFSTE